MDKYNINQVCDNSAQWGYATLYFLRMPSKSVFKIGITTNIKSRLKTLNSHYKYLELRISFFLSYRYEDIARCEKILHKKFSDKQVLQDRKSSGYTEWFDLSCCSSAYCEAQMFNESFRKNGYSNLSISMNSFLENYAGVEVINDMV